MLSHLSCLLKVLCFKDADKQTQHRNAQTWTINRNSSRGLYMCSMMKRPPPTEKPNQTHVAATYTASIEGNLQWEKWELPGPPQCSVETCHHHSRSMIRHSEEVVAVTVNPQWGWTMGSLPEEVLHVCGWESSGALAELSPDPGDRGADRFCERGRRDALRPGPRLRSCPRCWTVKAEVNLRRFARVSSG